MPDETIAVNRRARHDYAIEDTLEAGLVLTRTEIKSIRAHKVNIAEAYARSRRASVAHRRTSRKPRQGNRNNHPPTRTLQAPAAPRPDRRGSRASSRPRARRSCRCDSISGAGAQAETGIARGKGRTTSAGRSRNATCDASWSAIQRSRPDQALRLGSSGLLRRLLLRRLPPRRRCPWCVPVPWLGGRDRCSGRTATTRFCRVQGRGGRDVVAGEWEGRASGQGREQSCGVADQAACSAGGAEQDHDEQR